MLIMILKLAIKMEHADTSYPTPNFSRDPDPDPNPNPDPAPNPNSHPNPDPDPDPEVQDEHDHLRFTDDLFRPLKGHGWGQGYSYFYAYPHIETVGTFIGDTPHACTSRHCCPAQAHE